MAILGHHAFTVATLSSSLTALASAGPDGYAN